jgi:hypothetical protein
MGSGDGIIGRLTVSAARLLARPSPVSGAISDGVGAVGGRVALFALAHPDAVAEETNRFVGALLDGGFSVVLAHHDPARLAPLRDLIAAHDTVLPIQAEAEGVFALWRAGLRQLGLARPDTEALLLTSTGLRGPRGPLDGVLRGISDFAAADIWGLTDSWVGRYHLATGLLGVGPRALASPAWRAFWTALPALSHRAPVMRHLEVMLTQCLLAEGITAAALWPYQTLLDRAGEAFAALRTGAITVEADRARLAHLRRVRTLQANRTPMEPTNFFWQELIELGSPFLARDLTARNPYGIVTAARSTGMLTRMTAPAA